MTIFAYCQPHSLSADYTFPIVFLFSSLSFNGRPTKLRLPVIIMTFVIVMTFWYIFGTDLTFFELFKLYFHLGLITTPHVIYVHMTHVYSFSHVSFFT